MVWFYQDEAVNKLTLVIKLSIPLWSDFISQRLLLLRAMLFPFNPTMVWFYPKPDPTTLESANKLSIPLWSDFIYSFNLSVLVNGTPFNPTMVWFYRSFTFSSAIACTSFQSHYGLILSVHEGETENWLRVADWESCAFNPTMVWFYHFRNQFFHFV